MIVGRIHKLRVMSFIDFFGNSENDWYIVRGGKRRYQGTVNRRSFDQIYERKEVLIT